MKIRKLQACLTFLVGLVLGLATSVKGQDTTYTWVSSDGNPHGYVGTIVLDAPSSSGGALSDIVSLSVSGGGTIPLTLNTPQIVFDGGSLTFPFTWNSSQILNMSLTVGQPVAAFFIQDNTGPDYSPASQLYTDSNGASVKDLTGAWENLASVPEPTTIISGAMLLLPFGWRALRQLRTMFQSA